MFGLTPRYIREGRFLLKNAHKFFCYKRDQLSPAVIVEFNKQVERVKNALSQRDRTAVENESKALEKLCERVIPPAKHFFWRENCEVFLVAIVIALGVRTYFLQPFTIPTGSMQPTLNGVIGRPSIDPEPGLPGKIFNRIVFGRSYLNVVAPFDGTIVKVREFPRFHFFVATELTLRSSRGEFQKITVSAPSRVLKFDFGVDEGSSYSQGAVIARGTLDTGDHVFVDKISYHFFPPKRGDVFVFTTMDIPGIGKGPGGGSMFYIKRLAGLPGDEIRIDPPGLFVNGKLAEEPSFQRVMSEKNDYHGYFYGPQLFRHSGETRGIPSKQYLALGDNSGHSLDSRSWGYVPEKSIMGRALWVYWPFGSHWGHIN